MNLDGIRELAEGSRLGIIASGGVTELDDLRALKTLEPLGVTGVIAGRALYEGRFTVAEALAVLGRSRPASRSDGVHLKRLIIPALDVDKGRVVKGTNFVDIRDAGDPVELAARYDREGADEVVFLDITASHEKRDTIVELARHCAEELFIPFTIGGGIRSEDDVRALLGGGRGQGVAELGGHPRSRPHHRVRPALRLAVRGGGHRRQADGERLTGVAGPGRRRGGRRT